MTVPGRTKEIGHIALLCRVAIAALIWCQSGCEESTSTIPAANPSPTVEYKRTFGDLPTGSQCIRWFTEQGLYEVSRSRNSFEGIPTTELNYGPSPNDILESIHIELTDEGRAVETSINLSNTFANETNIEPGSYIEMKQALDVTEKRWLKFVSGMDIEELMHRLCSLGEDPSVQLRRSGDDYLQATVNLDRMKLVCDVTYSEGDPCQYGSVRMIQVIIHPIDPKK